MPNDHISEEESWLILKAISGDIYSYVPQIDYRIYFFAQDQPKSHNFILKSLSISMFSGFISLCITFY